MSVRGAHGRRYGLAVVAALAFLACAAPRLKPVEVEFPGLFGEIGLESAAPEPEAVRADLEAGWRALEAGELEPARKRFVAVATASTDSVTRKARAQARAGLGAVWLTAGKVTEAEPELATALALDPDSVLAQLGRTLAAHLARDDEESWSAYQALVPRATGGGAAGRALGRLQPRLAARAAEQAAAASAAGDLARASALYQRATVIHGSDAALARRAGEAALAAGEPELAARAFASWSALAPREPAAWLGLGEARLRLDDLEGARAAIEQAVALPGGRESGEALARRLREAHQGRLAGSEPLQRAVRMPVLDRAGLATILIARIPLLERVARPARPVILADVSGSPARAAIQEAVALGLLTAFDNHTVRPSAPVTRAELARASAAVIGLWRDAGRIAERRWQGGSIPDLPVEHLDHAAVTRALAYGVLALDAGGSFGPARTVSGSDADAAAGRLAALAR